MFSSDAVDQMFHVLCTLLTVCPRHGISSSIYQRVLPPWIKGCFPSIYMLHEYMNLAPPTAQSLLQINVLCAVHSTCVVAKAMIT